jgi:hypothetical protein
MTTPTIAAQSRIIFDALVAGTPIDALEGNVDDLLVAMGESGHLNPNNAYFFEANANGQLEVINDTEGWTLLVNIDTGEVINPPEGEITMPGPAPVSYYRVLVSQDGEKLFRTSRLQSTGAVIQALSGILAGFGANSGIQVQVQVLAVDADRNGRILCGDELAELKVG